MDIQVVIWDHFVVPDVQGFILDDLETFEVEAFGIGVAQTVKVAIQRKLRIIVLELVKNPYRIVVMDIFLNLGYLASDPISDLVVV